MGAQNSAPVIRFPVARGAGRSSLVTVRKPIGAGAQRAGRRDHNDPNGRGAEVDSQDAVRFAFHDFHRIGYQLLF
jgi:hypothetical protein